MKRLLVICSVVAIFASCNNAPESSTTAKDSLVGGADHTISTEKTDSSEMTKDSLRAAAADSTVVK